MATLRYIDGNWSKLQGIVDEIYQTQTFIKESLNTFDDGMHSQTRMGIQCEMNQIIRDTRQVIEFLNTTPLYRRSVKRPDDITIDEDSDAIELDKINSNLSQQEQTTERYLTESMEHLRQRYLELIDLKQKIVVPYAKPIPPTPLWQQGWFRALSTVAAVVLLGLGLLYAYNGINNIVYTRADTAFAEQEYENAIGGFNFVRRFGAIDTEWLPRFGFNYLDAEFRLARTYETYIEDRIDAEEYDKAKTIAQDFFDSRSNDNSAVNILHDIYIAEARATEVDGEWEQVEIVILELAEVLNTRNTTLEEDDNRSVSSQLFDLRTTAVDLLAMSYVERADVLFANQAWDDLRSFVAEDNLPQVNGNVVLTWVNTPLLRRFYLYSLQIEALNASQVEEWDIVERNTAELIDLTEDTELDYAAGRLLLASYRVEQATEILYPTGFVSAEGDDNEAESPENSDDNTSAEAESVDFEAARSTLEEAREAVSDDLIEAYRQEFGNVTVMYPVDLAFETYETERISLSQVLVQPEDNSVAYRRALGSYLNLTGTAINSFILDSYYREGATAYNAGAYETARTLMTEILELEPTYRDTRDIFLRTYYEPAVIAIENEDYATARQLLGTLITFDDGADYQDAPLLYREAYYIPALATVENNEYDIAVGLWRDLYAIDPNFRDTPSQLTLTLSALGETAIAEDRLDEAVALLEEIQAIDPDFSNLRDRLSVAYYGNARDLLDEGAYLEARDQLRRLQRINQQYRNTLTLLRETYYQPIARALAPMDANPDAETCQTIREDIEAFTEVINGAIDYRDTRLLFNETYYCEAQAAFLASQQETDFEARQQAFEDARQAIEVLINEQGIDPFYKDLNRLIIETFYIPAEDAYRIAYLDETQLDPSATEAELQRERGEAITTVRDLLTRLQSNDELYFAYYRDSFSLLRNTYYIPAYRAFQTAQAQFDAEGDNDTTREAWTDARDILTQILTIDNTYSPSPDFVVRRSNVSMADVLGTENLPNVSTLYFETFYYPASQLYNNESWNAARYHLNDLLDITPAYRDASLMLRNSYYMPGKVAFDERDWSTAFENFRALAQIDRMYRPVADATDTYTLLRESLAIPASELYNTVQANYADAGWEDLFTLAETLAEIDPMYNRLPEEMDAHTFSREMYYRRADLAETAAKAEATAETERLQAWEITLNSLTSLLMLDVDPTVSNPNLLFDVSNPYRDAQDRLVGVYHQTAQVAINAGNWVSAERTVQALLDLNPEDERANRQLRDIYFLAGVEAYDNGDYETARQLFGGVLVLNNGRLNPFGITGGYRTEEAQLYFRDSYYTDMTTSLERQDYAQVRDVAQRFLRLVSDDAVARHYLRLAYYDEATNQLANGEWDTARSNLRELLLLETDDPEANVLQDVENDFRDAQNLFRETYYHPAESATETENWGIARSEIRPLLRLDPNDSRANDILIASYLTPAQQAFDTGNWGIAADLLRDLFVTETLIARANLAQGHQYVPTVLLRLDVYMTPAQEAITEEDWIQARQNLEIAIDLGEGMKTDNPEIDAPINTRLAEAQAMLTEAYATPISQALAAQDWQSARELLDNLDTSKTLATRHEQQWYPSDEFYETQLLETYVQPIQVAILTNDYGTANQALDDLITSGRASARTIAQLRLRLINAPLAEAVDTQDWRTAATLIEDWKSQARYIADIDSSLASLLNLQQQLIAINGRNWRTQAQNTRRTTVAVSPFALHAGAGNVASTHALIGDLNGQIHWLDVENRQILRQIDSGTSLVVDVVYDPYGQWGASIHDDEAVRVWHQFTDNGLQVLDGHTNRASAIAVSPDGQFLASGDIDGNVIVWTTEEFDRAIDLTQTRGINTLAFTADSTHLVIASGSEQVHIVNLSDSAQRMTITTPILVRSLAVRPTEDMVAVAGFSNNVYLYSLDGELLRVIDTQDTWVQTIAFSPIGDTLLTISASGVALLHDPLTGDVVFEYSGNSIYDAYFMADGHALLMLQADGTLILWE
jgi:WD40 repeat protein/Flp pilus assembly protein TadD